MGLTKLPSSLIVCVFRSVRQVLDYSVNLSLTTSYHRLHCAENNDGNWKWTIKSALVSGFEGDFYGFNLKILDVN